MSDFGNACIKTLNDVLQQNFEPTIYNNYPKLGKLRVLAEGKQQDSPIYTLDFKQHAIKYVNTFADIVRKLTNIEEK
jgi:hypothetical protein